MRNSDKAIALANDFAASRSCRISIVPSRKRYALSAAGYVAKPLSAFEAVRLQRAENDNGRSSRA